MPVPFVAIGCYAHIPALDYGSTTKAAVGEIFAVVDLDMAVLDCRDRCAFDDLTIAVIALRNACDSLTVFE
jgi:hypothetical protein